MAPDDRFLGLLLAHQAELFAWLLAQGVAPADADDVLQEASLVLWRKFNGFDGKHFRAWAFSTLRLELTRWRSRGARQELLTLPADLADRVEADLVNGPEDGRLRRLTSCLQRLGDQARALLQAVYAEGLSTAAAAARLGISPGALRVRLHRVRGSLAACMERSDGGNGGDDER